MTPPTDTSGRPVPGGLTDLPAGLVAPSYGLESLAGVLPAAAGALGHELVTATGIGSRAAAEELAGGFGAVTRCVVVVVDGLGTHNLTDRGGHAPTMRGLLPGSRTLTSSFPSTTAAALATLGTGTSPARTGLLGYTQRNPATGGLATLVSWQEQSDPYRRGPRMSRPLTVAPRDLQREPTVLESLVASGVGVSAPGPRKYDNSGMTSAALRGPRYVVTGNQFGDAVDATVAALRARDGAERRLVYLYQGAVDKAGHKHGWTSSQWGAACEDTDRELRRLLRSVPRGTLVLVTADHGQVATKPSRQYDVAAEPALSEGVALLGGEPRALHVYTRDDADPADVAARWAARLGEDAVVRSRDEAVRQGWFGPATGPGSDVPEHVRAVIGDVVVAMTGGADGSGATTVVDSRLHSPDARAMPGVHGSLTPYEMHVPLLVAVA
ncbi:alkaline phosphatase family protein [Myceligenerans xiligouense]|uniref:Type I phosphodiesterase/nucleotide pyrophosphatase n=1 Tax=Myceligenerans xiligouense TaxID=253184 RepID=A0A3N4YR82_9MICO|nr:alkaline phosphatase family protein [Myceligenerans xiligouense]RPF21010.1 type I phosphodiesterase/nucleotide pyrophosphatase [Myceligenerans xiligouense]